MTVFVKCDHVANWIRQFLIQSNGQNGLWSRKWSQQGHIPLVAGLAEGSVVYWILFGCKLHATTPAGWYSGSVTNETQTSCIQLVQQMMFMEKRHAYSSRNWNNIHAHLCCRVSVVAILDMWRSHCTCTLFGLLYHNFGMKFVLKGQ